jgi:hypothetical protein
MTSATDLHHSTPTRRDITIMTTYRRRGGSVIRTGIAAAVTAGLLVGSSAISASATDSTTPSTPTTTPSGVIDGTQTPGETYTVVPGESISFDVGPCSNSFLYVFPVSMGSGSYNPIDQTITFTASSTFSWSEASLSCSGQDAKWFYFVVPGNTGSAAASFTPRPAPGPCIYVSMNLVVGNVIRFGDVTVGENKFSDDQVDLGSCTSIGQDVSAAISDASTGTTPGDVTWEPSKTTLQPNQFRYTLYKGTLDRRLDNTPTLLMAMPPWGYSSALRSELVIAPGSSTGIGETFSANLSFIATASSTPAP